jgi:hypothetical protein
MLYSFDTLNQLAILKKSHLQLFVSSNQETTPIINVITKQPVTKNPPNQYEIQRNHSHLQQPQTCSSNFFITPQPKNDLQTTSPDQETPYSLTKKTLN